MFAPRSVHMGGLGAPPRLVDEQGRPLDVTWVDPTELPPEPASPAERRVTESQKQPKARSQELPPEPTPLNPQVVENARPEVEEAPEHAKYVSEYDVSTAHPTRARATPQVSPTPGTTLAPNLPSPTEAPKPPSAAKPPVAEKPPSPISPLAMRAPGEGGAGKGGGFGGSGVGGVEPSPNGDVPMNEPGAPGGGARGQKGPKGGPLPPLSSLTPSDDAMARSTGTPVNDYIPDADEGEETLVNSRHWKFASFFNRVKRSVAERWHPDLDYRQRDPDGSVYGLRDRYTELEVTLNPDGSVKNIVVVRPSGIDFLDDDAVTAFRLAGPFPNPPQPLIDPKTGTIQFKFAFIFEISGTPSLRNLFRTE